MLLTACGGGSTDSASQATGSTQYQGLAQKGPFEASSLIIIQQLDSSGLPTGKSIKTTIKDGTGKFSYDIPDDWNINVNENAIQIIVEGLYLDETNGSQSDKKVKLSTITNNPYFSSVNLLTDWVAKRTRYLLNNGKSLGASIDQSEAEIDKIFGVFNVTQLDVGQSDTLPSDNALLLLLSGALLDVATQYSVNPQEIIDQVSDDFSKDGSLSELGDDWFIRMQAKIRDNPQSHIDQYSKVLKNKRGLDSPEGKDLPDVIPLSSRPAAILPKEIIVEPGARVTLDGSRSHDNEEGSLINYSWFRVDQQSFKVPVSDRFSPSPSITVPSVETVLLFALIVTDEQKLTDTAVIKVIVKKPTPGNSPPVAVNDSKNTSEDIPITLGHSDIVANDTDNDGDPLKITSVSTPVNGGVTHNSDGSVTFTPSNNFSGEASFVYTISDGKGGTDTATVTITVEEVNDAPVAVDDTKSTSEDTVLVLDVADIVTPNDSDIDGDPLTISAVSLPVNGAVILNTSNGTVTFTPSSNYVGAASFVYTISDGNGGTDTATVTIDVTAVNDNPVAVDDSKSTAEDTALNLGIADIVIPNDTDVDGDTLSISAVSSPVNGTVILNSDGTVTFTPTINFVGAASFDYTISDGQGGTDTATVTITVGGTNDVPVAVDDSKSTAEDTALTLSLADIVTPNDTDADGDTLNISAVSLPVNGIVVLNSDGTVTFTPSTNFVGVASFVYTISDGNGGTDTATVTIAITAVNDSPVAVDDSKSTAEDIPLTLGAADIVTPNDTDVDGDTLSISGVSSPVNGTVVLNSDGTVTFTPTANFAGTGSFIYTVSDNNGGTDTATVTITVGGTNDAPVAVDDSKGTAEDTALTLGVADIVTPNDTDADGDILNISAVSFPVNGVIILNTNGTVTFTPILNFVGTASFGYTVSDGNGGTDTATVTIDVTAVNDNPVAVDDSKSTTEDTALILGIADIVTPNDTDVDGDTLSISGVSSPVNGMVVLNSNGTVTFTPSLNFVGAASFGYTISDGKGGADTATVTITVGGTNDAPVAVDDSKSTAEDTALTLGVADIVTPNDTDADGDILSISAVSSPLNGTVVLNSDGTVTFTPTANFAGTGSFIYTVSDNNGGTDTAKVTITVEEVNDAPVAVDDTKSTNEDTAIILGVADIVTPNDSDIDGDPLTINAVSSPVNGTVILNTSNSTVTFTPSSNFVGVASFVYTISDGRTGTDTATVTVNVGSSNDAPVGIADSATTNEDTAVNITVLGNDTDADGDTLKPTNISIPSNGTAALNADGITIDYTPNANFNGTDTFTYTPNDGSTDGTSATVTVTVGAQNDPPVGVADSATTDEDTAVNINVISNDSDPDGDTLSPTNISTPSNGTAILNSDGVTIDYAPNTNFNGIDTFTYTPNDGSTDGSIVTVTVTVGAQNDTPVGVADSATTDEDTGVNINVILNDSDPDGDTLTPTNISTPSNGTAIINADGVTIDYTPNTNFNGSDAFTYTPNDGTIDGAVVTVTITINPINDAPTARSFTLELHQGENVSFIAGTGPKQLGGTDPENDSLKITDRSAPLNNPSTGTIITTVFGAGTVYTYIPNAAFCGTDSIQYKVQEINSGQLKSAFATVTFNVNCKPIAGPVLDIAMSDTDTTASITLTGSDTDGSIAAYIIITPPTSGDITGVTVTSPFLPQVVSQTITYTAHSLPISDSFTFSVVDDKGLESAPATVNVVVTNTTPISAYIKSPNPNPGLHTDGVIFGENFGRAVSLSEEGTTLAVGMPGVSIFDDSGAQISLPASVYVYTLDSTGWSRQASLKSSNLDDDDEFGQTVSLSNDGNTLVVGARDEDGSATGVGGNDNNDLKSSGAVYIFTRIGTTWTQTAYVKASNTDNDDKFGHSISVSGDGKTLVVGTPSEDSDASGINGVQNNNGFSSGAAYIFKLTNSGWVQEAYVKASNSANFQSFGSSVSLDNTGNSLIVGASSEDQGASDSGAVYHFVRTVNGWSQQSYIKLNNLELYSSFGQTLALSDDGSTFVSYAFEKSVKRASVVVFSKLSSSWTEEATVKALISDAHDAFGSSLAISGDGNKFLAGAFFEDSSSTGTDLTGADPSLNDANSAGAMYIFDRNGVTWSQTSYVKASNTDTRDRFGASVALSDDGKTIAVGAYNEDSNAPGINGDQTNNESVNSGAVYVNPHLQ